MRRGNALLTAGLILTCLLAGLILLAQKPGALDIVHVPEGGEGRPGHPGEAGDEHQPQGDNDVVFIPRSQKGDDHQGQ